MLYLEKLSLLIGIVIIPFLVDDDYDKSIGRFKFICFLFHSFCHVAEDTWYVWMGGWLEPCTTEGWFLSRFPYASLKSNQWFVQSNRSSESLLLTFCLLHLVLHLTKLLNTALHSVQSRFECATFRQKSLARSHHILILVYGCTSFIFNPRLWSTTLFFLLRSVTAQMAIFTVSRCMPFPATHLKFQIPFTHEYVLLHWFWSKQDSKLYFFH